MKLGILKQRNKFNYQHMLIYFLIKKHCREAHKLHLLTVKKIVKIKEQKHE